MSRKHPSHRLAPLTAALLCATSATLAQQAVPVTQVNNAATSASADLLSGPNGVATTTFATSSTTITGNRYDASGTGNQASTALTIENQSPETPAVSITQRVNAAVDAATAAKIGIDSSVTFSGNSGARTNASGVVSGNSAEASAAGNTSEAALRLQAPTLDVATPASVSSRQTASAQAPVTAKTTLSDLLGIRLLPRSGDWSELGLTVSGNEVSADAVANQATSSATVAADGALTLGAPITSDVQQRQLADATASSDVGVLGIEIGNTLSTAGVQPTASDFTVANNDVGASAQGNAQTNQVQVSAATLAQTADGGISASSTQHASGAIAAGSTASFIGVRNQKQLSRSNRYTVSGNGVAVAASGNAAANAVQVGATDGPISSIQGLDASASSQQTYAGAGIAANASVGQIGVEIGGNLPLLGAVGVSSGEQQVVSGNASTANASGSQASNLARLYGASVGDSAAVVDNAQTHRSGSVAASATVDTLGIRIATASTGNTQTVSDNTVQAEALGAHATNQAVIRADNASTGTAATVASAQAHVAGNTSATANVGLLGRQTGVSGPDTVTVNGNAVIANAVGTGVDNLAEVGGAAVTDSAAVVESSQIHRAGSVQADATFDRIGATATATVASAQNAITVSDNNVQASAQGAQATNQATVKSDGGLADAAATVNNLQRHLAGDVQASAGGALVGGTGLLSTDDQLVVSGNTLSASANSQSATNVATLEAATLAATGAGAGVGVSNQQTHAAGSVQAVVGDPVAFSPSVSYGATLVGSGHDAVLGGSTVVSGNTASADANVNLAANQATVAGIGAVDGADVATLENAQSVLAGQAASSVLVDFGTSGVRSLGNSLTVSGNTAAATASQNQAGNTLSVDAVNTLDDASPTLRSTQIARGETVATVETGLLGGTSVADLSNGDTTITGNQANASARANVANNLLAATAGTQAANLTAELSNTQRNTGNANATTTLEVQLGSLAVPVGGDVTVSGNSATALAIGNAALNALQASAGTALNASAPSALLNSQANSGAINATATFDAPLVVGGHAISLLNNSANATAIGNSAVNELALTALPGQLVASATLTSNQTNSGAVTASVVGNYTTTTGGLGGVSDTIALSGNGGSAQAVGNYANSVVTFGVQ